MSRPCSECGGDGNGVPVNGQATDCPTCNGTGRLPSPEAGPYARPRAALCYCDGKSKVPVDVAPSAAPHRQGAVRVYEDCPECDGTGERR